MLADQGYEVVNSPRHYQGAGGIEAIDVIESIWGYEAHLPTALIYILRHRRKGAPAIDLQKAQWWIRRWLTAPVTFQVHVTPQSMSSAAIAKAFGFDEDGHVSHAIHLLLVATRAMAEDRRRAAGRECIEALDRELARIGAAPCSP